jgi:hypothetical protein
MRGYAEMKTEREAVAEAFAKHELTVLADTLHVKAFRVGQAHTNCMMFEVVSTPYGITLFGDVDFDNCGAIGAMKPLGWFAGHLEADYLASKFRLSQAFRPSLAREHVEFEIAEIRREPDDNDLTVEKAEQIERLWDQQAGFECEQEYRETWAELLCDDLSDGCPGWGYDPHTVATLSAAQQAFRRLFWEMFEAIEKADGGGTRLVPKAQTAEVV